VLTEPWIPEELLENLAVLLDCLDRHDPSGLPPSGSQPAAGPAQAPYRCRFPETKWILLRMRVISILDSWGDYVGICHQNDESNSTGITNKSRHIRCFAA